MKSTQRSVIGGLLGSFALLAVYFGVLTAVSGWDATVAQFAEFWPFIVALAAGFGVQIALYLYLRQLALEHARHRRVVTATGTTSGAAMLACCTHYLANVVPIIGSAAAISFVAQYQSELFWGALAANAVGMLYIGRQCYRARTHFTGSHAC
jgi:Cu+-exporting ATPase